MYLHLKFSKASAKTRAKLYELTPVSFYISDRSICWKQLPSYENLVFPLSVFNYQKALFCKNGALALQNGMLAPTAITSLNHTLKMTDFLTD